MIAVRWQVAVGRGQEVAVRRGQQVAPHSLDELVIMTIRNYADLIAWQKAMTLAESVYKVTTELPREERYGLCAQMRRAAVSIPSNIAEGEGRGEDGNMLHSLRVSYGSLRELETQTLLAQRLPEDW